ncbi:hypothetical protein Bbelb_280610 [Branchiostoma belcheri]|nr:hypothetical protein Bbelb_280610 [Branchiostoma belcheri]
MAGHRSSPAETGCHSPPNKVHPRRQMFLVLKWRILELYSFLHRGTSEQSRGGGRREPRPPGHVLGAEECKATADTQATAVSDTQRQRSDKYHPAFGILWQVDFRSIESARPPPTLRLRPSVNFQCTEIACGYARRYTSNVPRRHTRRCTSHVRRLHGATPVGRRPMCREGTPVGTNLIYGDGTGLRPSVHFQCAGKTRRRYTSTMYWEGTPVGTLPIYGDCTASSPGAGGLAGREGDLRSPLKSDSDRQSPGPHQDLATKLCVRVVRRSDVLRAGWVCTTVRGGCLP